MWVGEGLENVDRNGGLANVVMWPSRVMALAMVDIEPVKGSNKYGHCLS